MSVRQQIIDYAVTLLATIIKDATVTVNGAVHTYTFTPAGVDAWRVVPFSDDELPLLNVLDELADVDGDAEVGRFRHLMNLSVRVADLSPFIKAIGEDNFDYYDRSAVRAMLLDVAQAVGSKPTFEGLVHRIRLVGHSIDAEQSSAALTVGVVTFTIEYRTEPFTL